MSGKKCYKIYTFMLIDVYKAHSNNLSQSMNILLLSAYHAQSHDRWCQGLMNSAPHVTWTVLSLPGRRFSWRYPGNAYSWFMTERETLQKNYDLIVATSMVNIATLRGLCPNLANTKTVVYCHENQFAYPLQHEIVQRDWLYFAIQNLYTVLAGDIVLFNSQYNQTSLLQGIRGLLKKMPDFAPKSSIAEIDAKSLVLPVPIEDSLFHQRNQTSKTNDSIHLVWNHRWEYDKGPEVLLQTLEELRKEGCLFTLSLVGQQFSRRPEAFDQIQRDFPEHLMHFGYLESKEDYIQVLQKADCVLSTAHHDFQGLAMMDAIASGCVPFAPNRLAYPEYIPEKYLYAQGKAAEEGLHLAERILDYSNNRLDWKRVDLSTHSESILWPKYHSVLGISTI